MIFIIKPTYACNLACKYCYLSNDTKKYYHADLSLILKALSQIREVIRTQGVRPSTLIWHGGEPLLWGFENFKRVFEFVDQEFKGCNIRHSIQTNLSLINEQFIELFKQYKVNVSFSLDGTQDIHDSQRIDKSGQGTFEKILNKYFLCKEHGLNPGCIVVATRKHIGRVAELYEFLANNGISFKLNPIFNSGEAININDEYGLSASDYARISIELFDLWYNDKQRRINNQKFADIASAIVTGRTSLCVFSKNCQDSVCAISPYGDVFPCGRFCDNSLKEYAYGNINDTTLINILADRKDTEVYKREYWIQNSECRECRYYKICNGGCLHDGFLVNHDFRTKSFLCDVYKEVFAHIENVLDKERKLYENITNI